MKSTINSVSPRENRLLFIYAIFASLLFLQTNCKNNNLPDIKNDLTDIDLKKELIELDGFTFRLPTGIKCIQDNNNYPDFAIYRFMNSNDNNIGIINLYVGNNPQMSDQNIKLTNSTIDKIHFKIYNSPSDTNNKNFLVETGFASPVCLHLWFDKKYQETALEIIRTLRSK